MFCCWTALTTSCGDNAFASMRFGFKSIMTWRWTPPYKKKGMTTPGTVTSLRPQEILSRSFNCCSERPFPDRPNCKTGTLEALKLMIKWRQSTRRKLA